MVLSLTEFETMLNDTTKRIEGDIVWQEDEDHSPCQEFRDKEAYVPDDITAPANDPAAVWIQFCAEAAITH